MESAALSEGLDVAGRADDGRVMRISMFHGPCCRAERLAKQEVVEKL
jgi:hypothetical protein